MLEGIINFLLTAVVLVIGGTMAFATFFIAESLKKERRRRN